MSAKTIYRGTKQLVKPHLKDIRAYLRFYPKLPVPERRVTPTATDIWRHYCRSMITSQQLITDDLWKRLDADPRWRALRGGGAKGCPTERALAALFKEQRIRFPRQKAARITTARKRDFEGLAAFTRNVLREAHDRRARAAVLRREEIRTAVAWQDELAGCGVAPKIARLAMRFTGEFEHVIPIDSRWKGALAQVNVEISETDFARESTYVAIEDELARAAYDLGVSPVLADGAVFGWVGASIEVFAK